MPPTFFKSFKILKSSSVSTALEVNWKKKSAVSSRLCQEQNRRRKGELLDEKKSPPTLAGSVSVSLGMERQWEESLRSSANKMTLKMGAVKVRGQQQPQKKRGMRDELTGAVGFYNLMQNCMAC